MDEEKSRVFIYSFLKETYKVLIKNILSHFLAKN